MSKKAEAEMNGAVCDYLKKQNRPYSVVDIFNNLHNKYGKTGIQKALDQLVAEKLVCEKSYGKQKVYVANQELMPAVSDVELKSMDAEIAALSSELNETSKRLKEAETEARELNGTLGTREALDQTAELEKELEACNVKLNTLANNSCLVSAEEKEEVEKERTKKVREWRKRKRCADDMVDAILDGYPKGKKALFEEVGLETDDDVGVKIPN